MMHGGPKPSNRLDFLSGGGEIGTLMRAHDWSATPLGPPELWQEGLKTLVGVSSVRRQYCLCVMGFVASDPRCDVMQ